jgi:Peptidase S24-like
MLSGGDYRAFEILGDSMLPTQSGSVIVCEKIQTPDEVKSQNTYIVVSKNEGIVYKRILKSNRAKNKLTLVSDNPVYQPYNINTEDVLEIWQSQMIISKANQQQRWDVDQLASIVNTLQDQVSTLKKRMN